MFRIRELWNSVFFRFTGAFIVVGLIPLFALSLFSLQAFTNHVQQYTVGNLSQMTMYMSYNLDNAFNQYNEITKLMYFNNMTNPDSGLVDQSVAVNERERINQTPIQDFLKTILRSDPYISSAYFVRHSDQKLYYESFEGTAFYADRLPIEEWLQPLRRDQTRLAVTLPHRLDYFYNSNRRVITFGRNLIDISGPITPERKVVGTLFFDVDVRMFEEMFSEMHLNPSDELYVIDGAGNVYYSNNEEMIGMKLSLPELDRSDKLSLSEPLSVLGGSIELRISRAGLFDALISMRSALYMVMVICTVIIIVMGTWFSRRLASPIRSVIRQMMKVESGNLDVQIRHYGQDEIGRLAHGFNRMVEHLNEFIKEAYVAEIGRKQAELNALKSQIRPHYLYNTLEVIRMNAVHNDDAEVADMILSLSNQLKYVIDYGEDWVAIHRELEHLENYFYIIKVRYENKIELKADIAPQVDLNWHILKLSLQPIVENAIQHGIRPKGGKGTVKVSIEKVGDHLQVTVFDDGVGMTEEDVARLTRHIHDQDAAAKGVGLKNVHERIRSACGEDYGVHISSRPHVGTSVRLLYPIREEGQQDDDSNRIGG